MHNDDSQTIAIVGMAGQFPGAENIAEFWQNLISGRDSITQLSDEALLNAGVDPQLLSNPHYVKACSALHQIEQFDADFFTMSREEAEMTDPQHRLLLETAYTALEDAACLIDDSEHRIGVFASVGISHYLLNHIMTQPALLAKVGFMQALLGNDKSYACTRISHKLNLQGPSMCIDTACSSSLVAIAQAVNSLLAYECDVALAGGAKINIPQKTGYLWSEGSFLSSDGRCRAFDADANGIIFGSGVGMVVLKRLGDAKNDGNHIYAVIKGAAVNNDGAKKISYTAPSMIGQTSVIAEAMAIAGASADSISYIEAHGTGTPLGDPIEIAALSDVFAASTQQKGFCAIGSLKTNIGYLEVASGVAGVMKTALALQHKQIPPSLHYRNSNPEIDFENTPFYVNQTLQNWDTHALPRRAGVSSFGIGGTNAHIVLEEPPSIQTTKSTRSCHLLILSVKTMSALERATENLAAYLQRNPEIELADVAYTLQCGRKAYDYRRYFVCESVTDAIAVIRSQAADVSRTAHCYSQSTQANSSSIAQYQHDRDDKKTAIALGDAWLQGTAIDWTGLYSDEQRRRLSLPTHPFERQRYWLDHHQPAADNTPIFGKTKISFNAPYVAPRNALEQRLANIWQQHLMLERIGIFDGFFDLGGDSIKAMAVIQSAALAGIVITPMQLFRHSTIAELTESMQAGSVDDHKTNQELQPEVQLTAEIDLSLPHAVFPPKTIFLTGATGFVGAFLLNQLLIKYPDVDIYCLVRARNSEDAESKLQANLAHYALWQDEFSARIKPLVGDLAKPWLGFSAEQFSEKADSIDMIVHCGAVVNFVSSYEQLKPANISGTCEVLKLASLKKIKPLHYISTVSVFPKPEYVPNQQALESETLDFPASYKGGYAQTKWVAEKIVLQAQSQGLPINIYRLGRITGSSQSGAWNTSDFLCKMIKGCIQLGLVPKTKLTIDFTPVDYVSDAIVHIMQSPELMGNTYHLVHPSFTSVKDLVGFVNGMGYSMKEVPYYEWYQALLAQLEQKKENALHIVMDLFEPSQEIDPWEKNNLAIDSSNTTNALKNSGIVCPTVHELLPVYFDYLITSHFLPKRDLKN